MTTLIPSLTTALKQVLPEPLFYIRGASAWNQDVDMIRIYVNPQVVVSVSGLEQVEVGNEHTAVANWAEAKIYDTLTAMREELQDRIDMIDAAMPRRHGPTHLSTNTPQEATQ